MQFIKSKPVFIGTIICIFATGLAMFIAQGIPIAHVNLTAHREGRTGRVTAKESLIALVDIFKGEIDLYDRPTLDLIRKARYYIFGYSSFWFHFINVFIFGLAMWMLFLFCYRYLGSASIGLFAALFYIFSPPIWMQVVQMEENSVLAELFTIIVLYLFLRNYLSNVTIRTASKTRYFLNNLVIIIITLLGVKTKGSAKVILPVLFLFVLFDDRKRLRDYIGLFIALLLVSAPIIGVTIKHLLRQPIFNEVTLDPMKIYRLYFVNPDYGALFGPTLVSVLTPLLLVLSSLGLMITFGSKLVKEQIKNEKRIFLFLIIWFLVATLLYIGYPEIYEPRYLTNALVPFSILIVLCLRNLYLYFQPKYRRYVALMILFASLVAFGINLRKIYQIRAAHWSSLIAHDNVYKFIEKEEKANGALIAGDLFAKTLSNLNTKNEYSSALPSQEQLDQYVKKYEVIYLVKCWTPLEPNRYRQKFVLIKTIVGESNNYFDNLKRWCYSRLKGLKKISAQREYYIYKIER